ncbi:MAG: ligase-associated DNA damage response endonuclease PdeM [Rhodobacteraceae bacterium]|nr:ligase-associated DNA damage response endonuclease PdeM [Paracoccaceae bacterium]
MNTHAFTFQCVTLQAMSSGVLWWPKAGLLCVSDLHLGKSERIARRNGTMVPPYETQDTLARLHQDIEASKPRKPRIVLCLGDSFDDLGPAVALPKTEKTHLAGLQAGRRWIWIEGNHDPGPVALGGTHLAQHSEPPLTFRHIVSMDPHGEISGHYHPKVELPTRGRLISRRDFLVDRRRIILPAYGTYTGRLRSHDPALDDIMECDAMAILTGPVLHQVPMPRSALVDQAGLFQAVPVGAD